MVDQRDESAGLPWLLGQGQGAVLALTLATIAPDLLSGVIAIRGCLPTFSQPDLLSFAPSVLPILLVHDEDEAACSASAVAATVKQLRARGARVTLTQVTGTRAQPPRVAGEIRQWFAGHHNARVADQ